MSALISPFIDREVRTGNEIKDVLQAIKIYTSEIENVILYLYSR